jgi:hypothetical protein
MTACFGKSRYDTTRRAYDDTASSRPPCQMGSNSDAALTKGGQSRSISTPLSEGDPDPTRRDSAHARPTRRAPIPGCFSRSRCR